MSEGPPPGHVPVLPVPVLAGARVLLTARRRGAEVAAALEERGATVVRAPTVACVDEGVRRVRALTRRLLADPPDVVVAGTATAVERWIATAAGGGLGDDVAALLAGARVLARGPKTRDALERAGVATDWLGEAQTSAELVGLLRADGLGGRRVLVLHGGSRDAAVEACLRQGGAVVSGLQVYRWVPLDDRPDVRDSVREVARGRVDAVLLTSAVGAGAWVRAVRREGVLEDVRHRAEGRRLLLAAVGPDTAEPLAYAGLPARTPAVARLADLVRLVLDELGDERHALRTGHGLLRLRAGAATLDHRPLPLSPSGLALLRRLASAPGHVVTREELLRVLPGDSADPHAAEVAVARLRDTLPASGLVRTVARRGYVLAAR